MQEEGTSIELRIELGSDKLETFELHKKKWFALFITNDQYKTLNIRIESSIESYLRYIFIYSTICSNTSSLMYI